MGLTDSLRAAASSTWEPQASHPFVAAFADGSLPEDSFRFYVKQDYVFLVEYARVFAACAAKAPDVALITRFAEMAIETTQGEMALHRRYAAEIGIPEDELEGAPPGDATRAYCAFLRRVASGGSFAETMASYLPCYWSYHDIATEIAARGEPADERIARWIGTYASAEWERTLRWLLGLMDATAGDLDAGEREGVTQTFVEASRNDLAFWEMCWTAPVDARR